MQTRIIYTKLLNELNNDITNESQIVYILLQIRKLLEIKNLKPTYPTLNLYCNWVLHSKLDHPATKRYFLDKFESYIDNRVDSKEVGKNIILNQYHFFVLNELKTQLNDFFKQNNLPSILTTPPSWTKFKKLLLEILMECPIEINGNKIVGLSLTKDNVGKNCYRFSLKRKLKDKKNVIKIKLLIK